MKSLYIGGMGMLLIGCALLFFHKSSPEPIISDAALCESRGGEWVKSAEYPLCMTPDEGLLELVDGAFVAFTDEDPWKNDTTAPLAGRALGEDGASIVISGTSVDERYADDDEQEEHVCDAQEMRVYTGKIAQVNFSSWPEAAKYQTAITQDVARGVNFAGSYSVSTWGCGKKKGDACVGHAIVDARTGNIALYDVIAQHTADFSLTSNVFSVTLKTGEEKKWSVENGELVSCE